MRRLAACVAISLLAFLPACNTWQIVVEEDFNPDPADPDYTYCQEETINPEALRNLKPNQGIRASTYERVLAANRRCIKSLGSQNMHNFETAKIKAKQIEDAHSDGMKWGAIGVLSIEVILVILYFL